MFILTLDDTTQRARSLAYAKALAPQMFARMGTQVLFRKIDITDGEGTLIAQYGRLGWEDLVPTPAITFKGCPLVWDKRSTVEPASLDPVQAEAEDIEVEWERQRDIGKWNCLVENPGNRVSLQGEEPENREPTEDGWMK